MTCTECSTEFVSDDPEEDICPKCQREWLREHCPEALPESWGFTEEGDI